MTKENKVKSTDINIKGQYMDYIRGRENRKQLEVAVFSMSWLIRNIEDEIDNIYFFVEKIGSNIFEIIYEMYSQIPFNYKDDAAVCQLITDFVDAYYE